ncbi:hypothetical protein GCM10009098_06340 [Rheinheimera aquimaris]|uniref:Uncharacterized protein n=1 Tax=Rheinheimera aquimaris TaxID=412437 RepID=A0ABN1DEI2_9GAMM
MYFANAHVGIKSTDHRIENTNINTGADKIPPSSSMFSNAPDMNESNKHVNAMRLGGIAYLAGSHLAANSHISQEGETATSNRKRTKAASNAISNLDAP